MEYESLGTEGGGGGESDGVMRVEEGLADSIGVRARLGGVGIGEESISVEGGILGSNAAMIARLARRRVWDAVYGGGIALKRSIPPHAVHCAVGPRGSRGGAAGLWVPWGILVEVSPALIEMMRLRFAHAGPSFVARYGVNGGRRPGISVHRLVGDARDNTGLRLQHVVLPARELLERGNGAALGLTRAQARTGIVVVLVLGGRGGVWEGRRWRVIVVSFVLLAPAEQRARAA